MLIRPHIFLHNLWSAKSVWSLQWLKSEPVVCFSNAVFYCIMKCKRFCSIFTDLYLICSNMSYDSFDRSASVLSQSSVHFIPFDCGSQWVGWFVLFFSTYTVEIIDLETHDFSLATDEKTEQKLTNETQHFPIDGWIHSLIVFEKLKLKHWKHFHGFECSSNDINERKSDGQISNTIDTRLPFRCFISSGKKEIIRYKRFFFTYKCALFKGAVCESNCYKLYIALTKLAY